MKKMRYLPLLLAVILLFTACGSQSAPTEDFAYAESKAAGAAFDMDMPRNVATAMPVSPSETPMAMEEAEFDYAAKEAGAALGGNAGNVEKTERKLIKNGDFSIETLKFDKSVEDFNDLVEKWGGYVQNSHISGIGAVEKNYYRTRNANFTVRIPANGFDFFEEALSECGALVSRNVYIDEVTDFYYDTEAHLKTLKVEEEQLLELMKDAKGLDSVIQLRSALSDVRYRIESLEGTLKRLDDKIALSTVNVYINEVTEPTVIRDTPKSLGERISVRFANSWETIVALLKNLLVFIAGDILLIIFWAAVIVAAILVIRFIIRRKKAKKPAKAENKPETETEEKKE